MILLIINKVKNNWLRPVCRKFFGLSSINANPLTFYCDKICVYNEHPIAGQDIQCRAPYSRSRYTTPFDENKVLDIKPLVPLFTRSMPIV